MVYIDCEIDRMDLSAAMASVSPQRRSHALRYRQEHDQRLSLAAYRLLQHALNEEYGITEPPLFDFGANGKPFIVGHPEIHFNLSHCNEAAACVVSHVPVGIDVESLNHYDEEIAEKVMNSDEQRQIASSSAPSLAFIRLWTMKESLLKMVGDGLVEDLRGVLNEYHGLHKGDYTFQTTIYNGFVCTVCALNK